MPSDTSKRTSITRAWNSTIAYLVGGIVCLGLCVLMFVTIASGPVTIGIALIPGIVGVLLFVGAVGSGIADCPGCGKQLTGLGTSSNDGVLCPHCHLYFEGKDKQLWATAPERIAEAPTFSAPLPERLQFP